MYCTIEDLVKDMSLPIIKELVNDENINPDEINLFLPESIYLDRVLKQIRNAEIEINIFLTNMQEFPQADTPDILNIICKDITIYYLYKRRLNQSIPDSILSLYQMRISQLKDIAEGKRHLNQISAESINAEYITNKTENDKLFTGNLLGKY